MNFALHVRRKKPQRRRISPYLRKKVLMKSDGHCWYCGIVLNTNTYQIDHIHPVCKGGTNDLDNLAPACRRCNRLKRQLSLTTFRYFLFGRDKKFWFEEQEAA